MPYLFSNEELADIHFVYGFIDGNAAEAAREYARRFPNRRHATRSVFVIVHRQIIENGFGNLQRDQNINVRQRRFTRMILREFDRDPTTSIRRVSGALGISASHVHRVLRNDHRRPYHLQPVQGLQPGAENEESHFFLSNVLWSDESCFTRRGVVNFHNQHIWSHENPHAIGIYRNRLFGPYLLPAGLNAATFLEFLKAEYANMWDDVMLDLRRLAWFQLDGCPAHYSRIVRNWLNENYPERWIGRGGPVAWPPRSPDLNPSDFFVCGFLKEKVYQTPVTTRDVLIDRIRNACDEIRLYLNNAIPRSIIRRCELCIEQLGLHFEQLLQILYWCRQRSLWDQEWDSIVFSDESRFCLGMHDGRARVRRRRGERRNPQFFVVRHVHTVGVMVWGAIAYGSRSPLIFVRGNMNAQHYIHEVLELRLLPYLDTLADPTFQQDNARPHVARVTIDFFQHTDVTLLPWPPRSPDLSPIEHLVVAWNEIPQEDIDHLIRSMPRRVGECVAHQGASIHY
ncbi:unnamed protein product [Acanthoscelides obtectus]|uniref:Tc1-like transposase DDE domain-containing protein n=1 Tax=Acanthoscelides obtectus TaxID=200917 RepID=A0A9P0L0W3_ACAOB|nr:unnamed protein product [Acanthoscelides obtectus]CAK1660422.1 Transposable element Tc3 transposase [Acanthoscelides obtectus]